MAGDTTPVTPREYRTVVPFPAGASSDRLGWVGLEAVSYRDASDSEIDRPPLTHHTLIVFKRPPAELDLRYEGVDRHIPPSAGSVILIPAGVRSRLRWRGSKDSFHIYLEPQLVARVAAESFGLDPARWTLPPLDCLDLPHLKAALRVLDTELTSGDAGGPLAAESIANVLAVHLIRYVSGLNGPTPGHDGTLARAKLRAVVDYVEAHLETRPTLAELADVAHLSPYHFARQFKAATGLPPHQYVLVRSVERAKGLLQGAGDLSLSLSLAQVAVCTGFSDQSQFSRHFKRLTGITPGRFRAPARITQTTANSPKRPDLGFYTILMSRACASATAHGAVTERAAQVPSDVPASAPIVWPWSLPTEENRMPAAHRSDVADLVRGGAGTNRLS